MEEILRPGLTQLGLDPANAPRLAAYGRLLIEKNQVMNLTAITDPVEVAQKHMLDCAAVLGSGDFKGKRVLDVGTGAGFPGLVLKICEDSIDLTLLDGLRKRLDWLDEISVVLNAPAQTIHGRAEEFGLQPDYREQFDLVTARAVADLRMLCELCLPFVNVGGQFLAMKAEDCQSEIDSAARCVTLLGGRLLPMYTYTIPGTGLVRRVVRVEKVAPTPAKYPRRFAKIQKAPL